MAQQSCFRWLRNGIRTVLLIDLGIFSGGAVICWLLSWCYSDVVTWAGVLSMACGLAAFLVNHCWNGRAAKSGLPLAVDSPDTSSDPKSCDLITRYSWLILLVSAGVLPILFGDLVLQWFASQCLVN